MKIKEHMIAVIEPARDGDSTVEVAKENGVIEVAKEVVDRGGRVTVLVLINRDTVANISAFAEAEDISFPDVREIYLERLGDVYSSRVGDHDVTTIVTGGPKPNRIAFDTVGRVAATSVVMDQRLATRRSWRSSVARSRVPVVIAPPLAA